MSGKGIAYRLIRNYKALDKVILTSSVVPFSITKGQGDVGNPSNFVKTQSVVRQYGVKGRKLQSSSSSDGSSSSDSEDGKRKKGQRGQSDFWRRKMRSHHLALDLNQDGFVSWDDFELLIVKFATLGNLSDDDLLQFRDAMKAVDRDHSGEISMEEFRLFYSCLGLNEKDSVDTFRKIDMNHDGIVTKKEFVRFGREFFLSEDEHSPSQTFWGPLAK